MNNFTNEYLALEITKLIVEFDPKDTVAQKTKKFKDTFLEVLYNIKKRDNTKPKTTN